MIAFRALILVAFVTSCAAARAQVTEIYKCVEPNGRPLYTSDKRETVGKKCELVSREINVAPPPASKGSAKSEAPKPAAGFPRDAGGDRSNARVRQREILEKELASEQQLLTQAQQQLAQQEAVRTGDERSYAKVLERLQPFRDSVETHQKNIEALRRELANLSR